MVAQLLEVQDSLRADDPSYLHVAGQLDAAQHLYADVVTTKRETGVPDRDHPYVKLALDALGSGPGWTHREDP